MSRWIYKKEILEILKGKSFDTEEEMEEYVVSKLPSLLKIKPEQIDRQSITTSFDGTLSNCADIVIRTDDKLKVILVIEFKLTKSVDKFKDSNYTDAVKQLHKYCQDVRSLYGILLTEDVCFIYKYKYFRYDDEPERDGENRIPNVKIIENKMMRIDFINFMLHKKSLKYILLALTLFYVYLRVWDIFIK